MRPRLFAAAATASLIGAIVFAFGEGPGTHLAGVFAVVFAGWAVWIAGRMR